VFAGVASDPISGAVDKRTRSGDGQRETIALVLPALYVAGFILAANVDKLQSPIQGRVACLLLTSLPIAIWLLCRVNYELAAWTLVLGCLAVDLLVVVAGDLEYALGLLALPAGMAALFVSAPAGILVAFVCTILLLVSPFGGSNPFMQATTLAGVWGTVGLVLLTLRRLRALADWTWIAYRRNADLLEQARDDQVHLKQAMEDLEDANLQLTRLNRVAQALRHAAEEARAAKERFAANVSHELRTPLNMIIGFADMITDTPDIYGRGIPPALLVDLDVIRRNSQHLSKLIDDVLDMSQLEVGRMALTKESVMLHEMVEAAVTAVRPLYDSKHLYLEVDLPRDLPPIFCDRTRIRQVLLNLLSNSGRFTDSGGVRLRAWHQANDLMISVTDTGPGIADQDADRIFQPFQQLQYATRPQQGGSGLGLSISRGFIRLHGGDMWFESTTGIGSAFFVRLPLELPLASDHRVSRWFSPHLQYSERVRRSAVRAATLRPRFVVVDSEGVLCPLLSRYMDNPEIVPAANLREAVHELSRAPSQGLLVNRMALEMAVTTLNEIADLPMPRDTPVIVSAMAGVQEAARALSVSEYLTKPVSRDTLLAVLDRLNLKGRTVLAVVDEPESLRLLRRMLVSRPRGYRVLGATRGQEAMSLLCERHPDVVLVDSDMATSEDFQFLAAKNQNPSLRDTPVVVISARDPVGRPAASPILAILQRGGMSAEQFLACVEALSRILSTAGRADDLAPTGEPGAAQAC
jgi:signal transduction histidine kinase/CheY-like chemotaxis protein